MRCRAVVGALLLVTAVGACGVLPPLPAPAPAPSDYVPSLVTPAPLDTSLLTPEGVATTEAMAVRIRNVGCDKLSTGTGFAVDKFTLITNKHVVEGASYLQVQTYDGTDVSVTATAVASIADLAVVRVQTPLPSYPSLAATDPAPGDKVSVVGYPNGGQLTVTTGQIVRVTTDPLNTNLGNVYVTSAKVNLGSSGSAALNHAGQVIGVVYAKNKSDDSYLVPVQTLRKILASTDGFTPLPPCQNRPPASPTS